MMNLIALACIIAFYITWFRGVHLSHQAKSAFTKIHKDHLEWKATIYYGIAISIPVGILAFIITTNL